MQVLKNLGIWILVILWMAGSPACLVYRKLTTGRWLYSGGGSWSGLGSMLELLFAPFVLIAWIVGISVVAYIHYH